MFGPEYFTVVAYYGDGVVVHSRAQCTEFDPILFDEWNKENGEPDGRGGIVGASAAEYLEHELGLTPISGADFSTYQHEEDRQQADYLLNDPEAFRLWLNGLADRDGDETIIDLFLYAIRDGQRDTARNTDQILMDLMSEHVTGPVICDTCREVIEG
jgi:hypothetical protein